MLLYAIILMFSALTCYSIGVWGERLSGLLKPWHLAFFWAGLVSDTSGTTIMSIMSNGFKLNVHGITGAIAILLMIFHAIWATIVLSKGEAKLLTSFHTFSLFVWLIWLIPFFTGMFLNVS